MKFLSEEWAKAVTDGLGQSPKWAKATKGKKDTLQITVTGAPNGDVVYHLRWDDSSGGVDLGPADAPKASFEMAYEIACKLSDGSLSAQAAAMTKKIRTDAKLPTVMSVVPPLDAFIEVDKALASDV